MDNYEEKKMLQSQIGCGFCWNEIKNKEKQYLFFFDAANNYRPCRYCPNCGRKYLVEEET